MAIPNSSGRCLILYDFDAATGTISNELKLYHPTNFVSWALFGVEFSANGKFIYSADLVQRKIYQWDIQLPDTSSIAASREQIVVSTEPGNFGSMQLANNGKIYIARAGTNYLGVINSPESSGLLANFNFQGIDLSPKQCRLGLPTFIQSLNYNPFTIQALNFCLGTPTQFSALSSDTLTNFLWHFGDSTSGMNNTSTVAAPSHTFSTPGNFVVTLTANFGNNTYTQSILVTIPPQPSAAISPTGPINICAGTTANLQAAALPNLSYQWLQNGQALPNDTLPNLSVSASGTYQVMVTDSVCAAFSDSIQVNVHPQASAQISPASPQPVCFGQPIPLSAAQSTGNTYAWLLNGQAISGANGPVFAASSPGHYQVIVSSSGFCADTSAATVVDFLASPVASVTPAGPLSFCSGDSVVLIAAPVSGATYQWLHNNVAVLAANNPVFAASSPGNYQVIVTSANLCADTSMAVTVTELPLPQITITQQNGPDCHHAFTLNASGAETYSWSTGATGPVISVLPAAAGFYAVTGQNQAGCAGSASVVAEAPDCEPELTIPNIITPNNDGVNDVFVISGLGTLVWELSIFNRWGKQVYHSREYKNDWSGAELPEAVYFYLLKHQESGQAFKGFLEIHR